MEVIEGFKVIKCGPRIEGGYFDETPTHIVAHATHGGSAQTSIDWMTRSKEAAFAHIVISRKGTIYLLCPLIYKAWHAGNGSFSHRPNSNPNDFTIGIEFANMGRLRVVDTGEQKEFRSIYPWNSKLTVPRKDVVFDGETPYEAITTYQMNTFVKICHKVDDHFGGGIKFTEHRVIDKRKDSEGRKLKTDIGPAFRIALKQNAPKMEYVFND